MATFGEVLSVNTGRAAPMSVQGETIVTGFDKRSTDHPVQVEFGGLVADDHVDDVDDLDRAVLFYQRSHYQWWAQELGRSWEPGSFGEQLTIDGPTENDIVIGDVLRIGSLVVEVTQPRIPCRKMAVRLDQEDMPIRYMRSGRVGFFCKVIEPGVVSAGDRIELVRRGPDGVTVAELANVLHRDEPDPVYLERILSSSTLPILVRTKLTALRDRMAARAESWVGDRRLRVGRRTPHGSEIVAFDLVDPDGERLPDFQAGQFLTVALDVPGLERPLVRTYTIAGRSADGSGYRIAVKREPAPLDPVGLPPGLVSGHLHDAAPVGVDVVARAPRGRFVLASGNLPVILVSAGIGITPMVAMLEELTADSAREVFFIHIARSSKELAFGSHVQELVRLHRHLHSVLLFSRPQPADRAGLDYDHQGRLTSDVLQGLLPGLDADFYVCGPGSFMADIVSGLRTQGVPDGRIHYEFFGVAESLFCDQDTAAGPEAVDAHGRPILVTFARSGLTVPWRDNSFSLLALAEQAGLRPPASCRTGLCNTCVCRIDDGEIEYVIEPMDAVTPGKVAVCCARPRTSIMVDL